jgi:hypothetical protein
VADSGVGLRFALASLATWRVTHLLAEEDGPWDAVVRARARLGRVDRGAARGARDVARRHAGAKRGDRR